jgi:serine/threonine protein kinase
MKKASPLTVVGTIIGSPSYIAPEVWKGKPDELDHRVDLYSLAVILFRALAGRLPFDGESLHEKFVQATTAKRPSLHAIRDDLPSDVDGWVKRALAIDRSDRFGDVRKMWNALLSALEFDAPARPIRPVTESLVTAWRSAASAFRRFVDRRSVPTAEVTPSLLKTSDDWIDVDDTELLDEDSVERSKIGPAASGSPAVTDVSMEAVEIEPDEWSSATIHPPDETPSAVEGEATRPPPKSQRRRNAAPADASDGPPHAAKAKRAPKEKNAKAKKRTPRKKAAKKARKGRAPKRAAKGNAANEGRPVTPAESSPPLAVENQRNRRTKKRAGKRKADST